MRRTVLLFLAVAGCAAAGCAAPCKRARSSHDAFQARTEAAQAPHLSVSIPFAVVDQIVAAELKQLKTSRMRLPKIAGVSLGNVTLSIERVRATPAPNGQLGFHIVMALNSGRSRILGLDVDARVRPVIDPKRGTVVVALRGEDLQSVRPSLAPGSSGRLANLVWNQLPPAARMLTSKGQIEGLTRGLADELMSDAFALAKRDLLPQLGEVARVELELPEVPLATVDLRTEPGFLTLLVRTSLPVSEGLAPGTRRPNKLHANAVAVQMSGATAAELANHAIDTGELPQRWSLDGSPDPAGPLWAGVGWDAAGAKPLKVHLWKLDPDCAHVRLGATPTVTVDRGHLMLRTNDAKIENVEGPLKVRAGIWFSGLGRQTFSVVEQTAASISFDVGGQPMTAAVQSATVGKHGVTMGLVLRRAPRRARG